MIVEENEDIKSGYKIRFIFEENPYFENTELVKDIHLPYGSPDEKPYTVSTEIKWKKGMDLLKVKDKKPKKKAHWNEHLSFLQWLTKDMDPTGDEIAEVLKDDLWPNPIQYYLAPELDMDENGVDDEDEGEEMGDEEDSEDDQENVVIVEEDEEDDQEIAEDDIEEEEAGGDDQAEGEDDEEA
jgi:template-activating factor I